MLLTLLTIAFYLDVALITLIVLIGTLSLLTGYDPDGTTQSGTRPITVFERVSALLGLGGMYLVFTGLGHLGAPALIMNAYVVLRVLSATRAVLSRETSRSTGGLGALIALTTYGVLVLWLEWVGLNALRAA